MKAFRIAGLVAVVMVFSVWAEEQLPDWWADVKSAESEASNYSPSNIGQLKNVVVHALDALIDAGHETLAGQIRTDLDSIFGGDGLEVPEDADAAWYERQREALLLGQLKAAAKPFYDRLHEWDPDWLSAQRETLGTQTEGSIYPWTNELEDDANFAIANIGQLKAAFAFDFSTLSTVGPGDRDYDQDGLTNAQEEALGTDPNDADSDNDGLADGWEAEHGLNPLEGDPFDSDSDQDGVSDHIEYLLGFDPNHSSTDGEDDLSSDGDNDGMPDWWEAATGSWILDESSQELHFVKALDWLVDDADEDYDLDENTNVEEYWDGTDPTDPEDVIPWKAVRWTNLARATIVGSGVHGSSIEKDAEAGRGWSNAGASSERTLLGDGVLQLEIPAASGTWMLGLGVSDESANYREINYALYKTGHDRIFIYESGALIAKLGAVAEGDIVEVRRRDGIVSYWQNGEQIFESSRLSENESLVVDSSLNTPGAKAVEVRWRGAVLIGDLDEDGLPDDWEERWLSEFGYTSIEQIVPDLDFDGDGKSNLQEFLDGSDPTDAAEFRNWKAVSWEYPVNTIPSDGELGSNLTRKPNHVTGWNADAVSKRRMEGDGTLQFRAATDSMAYIAGWELANTTRNFSDLQYAFYVLSSGKLYIYEKEVGQRRVGSYKAGDVLELRRRGTQVSYWQNGEQIAVSTRESIDEPFYVDGSLRSERVVLSEARWSGASLEGDADEDGIADLWEESWFEGFGVDSIEAVLPNEDFDGDGISNLDEYREGSDPTDANDFEVWKKVRWTNLAPQTVVGENEVGSILSKPIDAGRGWWNSGGSSVRTLLANGVLQMTVPEDAGIWAVGLSTSDTIRHLRDMEYAFQVGGGRLTIYEKGAIASKAGFVSPQDVLEIRRVGNRVSYLKNGEEIYRSLRLSEGETLVADSSLLTAGAIVESLRWKGAIILGDLDEDGLPDEWERQWLAALGLESIESFHPDEDSDGDGILNIDEYRDGSDPTDGGDHRGWRPVQWTQHVRTESSDGENGSRLEKVSGGNRWNAGAISEWRMPGNGVFQFEVEQLGAAVVVGLGVEGDSVRVGDVLYGASVQADGRVRVYESGRSKGIKGSVQAGDTIELRRVGGVVSFWINGVSVYTSLRASVDEALLVDASLHSAGGAIGEARWRGAVDPEGGGDEDSDGDGLIDALEREFGSDPNKPDTDDDGIGDLAEYLAAQVPAGQDSDGDGMSDRMELLLGQDPEVDEERVKAAAQAARATKLRVFTPVSGR